MEENSTSLKNTARLAGLLYFIFALTAIYGSIYVPSKIMVPGDTAATANSILANEFLFRTALASNFIGLVLFLFLVLILFRLFNKVNVQHARYMVGLVLVGIPVAFLTEVLKIAALKIFKGEILRSFAPDQMHDLAMVFLKFGSNGAQMVTIFWGLWLIPLGLLVYKS